MEAEISEAKIYLLPIELLNVIIDYISIKDAMHFASTCKQYNEFVRCSQGIWRNKMKKIVNKTIYEDVNKIPNVNWYNEIRSFFNLNMEVHRRLIQMTYTYYTCSSDSITLDDVRSLFQNTFENSFSYYSTIYILQELYKKASEDLSTFQVQQPYTLTEMHYAKIVLEHLMHAYLAMTWVHSNENVLPPEIVLNFFIQWVDPLKFHAEEDVNNEINELAAMVVVRLQNIFPSKKSTSIQECCESGDIKQEQILAAISHVIYVEKNMSLVEIACLDTLNIKKVLKRNVGHKISIAAIYQAVAKRLGVVCHLRSFPGHLFLEWWPQGDLGPAYSIALDTGIRTPKGVCPFSRNSFPSMYSPPYTPRSFLEFVLSIIITPMTDNESWHMKNAMNLSNFLQSNRLADNRYSNYMQYLMQRRRVRKLTTPIDIIQLTDDHMGVILLMGEVNKSNRGGTRPMQCQRRSGNERFAVGMVCWHAHYEYTCVVRGWEAGARDARSREYEQPYYSVLTADASHRHVTQEDLVQVSYPERIDQHLEDELGKEFSHFNGFSYVPNTLKRKEYPDDLAVAEAYASRANLPFTTEH